MPTSSAAQIYEHAPRWAQIAALNCYGIRNRWRQAAWQRIHSRLQHTERLPPDEQVRSTRARLRSLLLHALDHVPRYSSLPRLRQGLRHAEGVFDALADWPVITRDEVLDRPEQFRSRAFRHATLVRTETSGTTGTPFTTLLERRAHLVSDALWWRRTVWAGYRPGDWIARLVGDMVVPLRGPDEDPPWRISHTDRRIYLSTFHLREATAIRILDLVAARSPRFIMGYPSALAYLARVALGNGWRPRRPFRAVLFSSEPMLEHQADVIARVFEAPLRGLYGCAERIVSAAQCKAGSYHLALVDGFVEGQFGELPAQSPALITGLLNRAMPLIRFRLGDRLEHRTGESCACGRTLPMIAPVITKAEDCVQTPSGRVISPSLLTWAFKGVDSVRQAQVRQVSIDTLEVLIAPDNLPSQVLDGLESRLREFTFGEMQVTILARPVVQVAEGGKSRFVVNLHASKP